MGVADSVANTLACSRKCQLNLNFLRKVQFPMPYRCEVASHPRTACRKRMLLHISGPSCSLTALMLHTLGFFIFFLGSGKKKCFENPNWHNNTAKRVDLCPHQPVQRPYWPKSYNRVHNATTKYNIIIGLTHYS